MTEARPTLEDLRPPPHHNSLLAKVRRANEAAGTRLVILDDDPLGGQCLHDVPVLTSWEPGLLASELRQSPVFLLLTNTRALSRPEALQRSGEVGLCLRSAAREAGLNLTPVWRSDSTLRGHFYWEMQAFDAAFSDAAPGPPVYVLLPYFGDGGRFTLSDTQYVLQDGALVPAAQTEFARDPAFAYTQPCLPDWLEHHSEGRCRAEDVVCISLDDLRSGGPGRVADLLGEVAPGCAVVVNATADADLEVFVAGLQHIDAAGRRFLCSGAAPFVRVRAGLEVRPALSAADIGIEGSAGGLTVVGSYADRTKAQLAGVANAVVEVPLDLDRLAAPGTRAAEVRRAADAVSRGLATGRDVVLHSSLDYRASAGSLIADALAEVASGLEVRPRYLLVKGGTTASRIATEVLGVKRATVLGQLMPGVPVWRLGAESRWPGLPLAIFPGNVGGPESLAEALRLLRGG